MTDTATKTSGPWTWAIEDLIVNGTAADDTLYGGKGQDRIDGGSGTDTVSYGGNHSSYQVTHDAATGTYTVTHLGMDGRDVDTLTSIERLRFGNVEAPIAAFADDAPAGLRPVVFTPTEGADFLVGREYAELIEPRDGDDTLRGNGGDDRLYGGKGEDTALYAGDFADYELVFDQYNYAYRLTDRVSGRDGSDLLGGVEKLRFADLTVVLTGDRGAHIEGGPELLPAYVPPPPPYQYFEGAMGITFPIGLDDGAIRPLSDGWVAMDEAQLVGTTSWTHGGMFLDL